MTHPFRFSLNLAASAALAGALVLSGCSRTADTVKDAASGAVDAAKTAATAGAQGALAPAVNPVLELLKKGQGEVEGGNLAGASTTIAGFKGLWEKAAPVIKPLAGDKFPAIEAAAAKVTSTFAGATPDKAAASSAISGLIGPLSGLMGQ
ncbi:hypothetical protein [Cyanobium sp. ATX 6F1]|uniref:hypothetical protein n=1 Tax=unclassified Cyanobium TaxID=2627006 RepID=UPI0020CE9D01|nr:hypothetical protein [Cyanobium sp. ATX 6F1]MCP9917115.1 hypothetical protein [Cyanobium sp. ATX 6F1]